MSDSSIYDWDAVRILTLALVIHSWNQTVGTQWKLPISLSSPSISTFQRQC